MRCHDCDHGLDCCHATSVEHADGTTECLGEEPCSLDHDLHRWALTCADAGGPCARTPGGLADAA